MARSTRTSSNFKVPRRGTSVPEEQTGRSKETIYDDLIDGYLEVHGGGVKWIVISPDLITQEKKSKDERKTVETMRMMLNQRLEERKPKNLRYEVKVRAVVLTEKMKAEDEDGLFEGYEVGDRVVLLTERDQTADPYDPSEKNIPKSQGARVNAPKE